MSDFGSGELNIYYFKKNKVFRHVKSYNRNLSELSNSSETSLKRTYIKWRILWN